MPPLRDPQHEAFAQRAAVPGVRLIDAYEAAGYVRRRGNPDRLARKPHVAARIAELRSQVHPGDLANLQRIRTEILELAERLPGAAGNRDAVMRSANDVRHLADALEQQAAELRHLAAALDRHALVDADSIQLLVERRLNPVQGDLR
jgi:hypothetical protein